MYVLGETHSVVLAGVAIRWSKFILFLLFLADAPGLYGLE